MPGRRRPLRRVRKRIDRSDGEDHNGHMKNAGIADLKARLSSYLKQVKAGHEVLITERGVVVAKLVPLEAAERRDSRRVRLAKEGRLILGRGSLPRSLLSPPKGDPMVGASVLAALLEERAKGR